LFKLILNLLYEPFNFASLLGLGLLVDTTRMDPM